MPAGRGILNNDYYLRIIRQRIPYGLVDSSLPKTGVIHENPRIPR
jgi:hypothetical protein